MEPKPTVWQGWPLCKPTNPKSSPPSTLNPPPWWMQLSTFKLPYHLSALLFPRTPQMWLAAWRKLSLHRGNVPELLCAKLWRLIYHWGRKYTLHSHYRPSQQQPQQYTVRRKGPLRGAAFTHVHHFAQKVIHFVVIATLKTTSAHELL